MVSRAPGRGRVVAIALSGFRNLEDAELDLGRAPICVVHGPNGAGKTNLLEALYFGLVGRSCRTRREREMIAHGAPAARVVVELDREPPGRRMSTALSRDGERRRELDGTSAGAEAEHARPAVAVFLPERLELVKGPPSARRGHIDSLAAALRPSRAPVRARYSRALAQRNALLGRIRGGRAPEAELATWDTALAQAGHELIVARDEALAALGRPTAEHFQALGGDEALELEYRPRSRAESAEELERELADHRGADLERGFSTHGPHLDEVRIARGGRLLRTFGSQGQQRLAVLALLLAEREVLLDARGTPPLLLLDDVMSELDPRRRQGLVEAIAGGQALITTTEAEQVPAGSERELVGVEAGEIHSAMPT